jgi:8-oxo-dGTP pyrophosphatase MutT (NUDIX family)
MAGGAPITLAEEVRGHLIAHVPRDRQEARSRLLALKALELLPAPFDRHAAQTHLTASGLIDGPRGIVLHRYKRTGAWLQPGGHLEAGEAPWDAALRECCEETGLSLQHAFVSPELIHVDARPLFDHFHLDLRYAVRANDEDPSPPPGESQAVRWFSWEEALGVANQSLRAALAAFEARSSELWSSPSWR